MSPHLVTWIFVAGAIALAGLSLWRRRGAAPLAVPPRPQTPVYEPISQEYSLPEPAFSAPVMSTYTPLATEPVGQVTAPTYAPNAPAPWQPNSLQSSFQPSFQASESLPEYRRQRTFESLSAGDRENKLPQIDPAQIPLTGTDDYLFGPVTPILSSLLPESEARQQELRKELVHAGYYQPHAIQNLNAIRYLAVMLPMIAMGALFILSPRNLELPLLLGMVGFMIVGWALPRLYVRGQAADRKSQIEKGLPDVLDLLNMCVSQGMTPLTAMKRVTHELREVYPEITEELRIVSEQAEIGSLRQALENMRTRLDIPEIHSFTNLLLQTEKMGTSVSVALAEYAERMRESLRQRADQKANQASFKLLFPTVLCLMPAVYMFLLGPSVIELTDFFAGRNRIVNSADEAFQNYTDRYSPPGGIINDN